MRLRASSLALPTVLGLLLATAGPASGTMATNIPDSLRDDAATDAARDLLERADEVLNGIRSTSYSTRDVWRPNDGLYEVVCTGFVNHLLDEALPDHLDAILEARDKGALGLWDYYAFFRSIAYGDEEHGWRRLRRVADLRPGDLVAWRYSEDSSARAWGHIMVVASVPVRDPRWSGAYRVRVADSTSSPHGASDSREDGTGVGAGEILLRAGSETGAPWAFAWSTRGIWRTDVRGFALARPAD